MHGWSREELKERHKACSQKLQRLVRKMDRQQQGSNNRRRTRKTAEKWLRKLRPMERALGLPRSDWPWADHSEW